MFHFPTIYGTHKYEKWKLLYVFFVTSPREKKRLCRKTAYRLYPFFAKNSSSGSSGDIFCRAKNEKTFSRKNQHRKHFFTIKNTDTLVFIFFRKKLGRRRKFFFLHFLKKYFSLDLLCIFYNFLILVCCIFFVWWIQKTEKNRKNDKIYYHVSFKILLFN